jgi:hypothetical protein
LKRDVVLGVVDDRHQYGSCEFQIDAQGIAAPAEDP